ncbi:TadE/TadG family type IV pilus assembly protein [Streptomyces sp. cg28]|uniref:TadE/TadG family type IV pilus assembly protein n=1 Tax=Streptomyces sp. cg28 TaxID=3403457 RepID=UPI003B216CD2
MKRPIGARGTARPATTHARLKDDRGVSMLEFAGFLPFLLVIGMAAIQLGLVGYGANQAGSAARAGARAESLNTGSGPAAATASVSGWLEPAPGACGGDPLVTCTVTVHVKAIIPLFDGWDITRTVTMPSDQTDQGS